MAKLSAAAGHYEKRCATSAESERRWRPRPINRGGRERTPGSISVVKSNHGEGMGMASELNGIFIINIIKEVLQITLTKSRHIKRLARGIENQRNSKQHQRYVRHGIFEAVS